MYNIKTDEYIECGDFATEFETTYYLKYNIEKALFAIGKIYNKEIDFSEYSNPCVYYHIYIDLLLEAVGQILNRFIYEGKIKKIYKDMRDKNCLEYNFNKETYPVLYEKEFRNFVAHIDERNLDFIESNKIVGGFNVIFEDTSEEKQKEYLNFSKQNNTLDLKKYIYYIYSNKKNKIISLNLKMLEDEIKRLALVNKRIWNYIT